MKEEICDLDVTLIDTEFGYGSQSLINMMITGQAVSNVFNNDQVVAGLSKFNNNARVTLLNLCQFGFFSHRITRYCEAK